MPEEDKHNQILEAIECKAKEIKFGILTIELKIHNGRLSSGEVISQREKLG